ncbi:GNAT family N-acetyltransferase [Lachnoclostridium edouardi]|uniref:GNAT family N-acetyltransferase n=1 Tax=Lachnoclostridium edouardi TaxID=1926283 RepID=UPI000C7CC58B|nr:GNAT family N-acetyltransferase [Lachnoclostridium edouardi]
MEIKRICQSQWSDVKNIYMEAFPKAERKPFFLLKRAAQKEKSEIWVASENGVVAGFIVLIPYRDMVLVEYLAVSNKIRSKGTGSKILGEICRHYANKRILLLIEEIDEAANNLEQRIARKRFYLKNGFQASGISVRSVSGNMELLCYGSNVTEDEFIEIQAYTLGKLLFRLSRTRAFQTMDKTD